VLCWEEDNEGKEGVPGRNRKKKMATVLGFRKEKEVGRREKGKQREASLELGSY
jgi:hypothetical protein